MELERPEDDEHSDVSVDHESGCSALTQPTTTVVDRQRVGRCFVVSFESRDVGAEDLDSQLQTRNARLKLGRYRDLDRHASG